MEQIIINFGTVLKKFNKSAGFRPGAGGRAICGARRAQFEL